MEELKAIAELVGSGGQASLLVSVYFIWRLERRLSRIEKALEKYLEGGSHGSSP